MRRTRRTLRLSDDFWNELGELAEEKKVSRAELIRRAVEEEYGIVDQPLKNGAQSRPT